MSKKLHHVQITCMLGVTQSGVKEEGGDPYRKQKELFPN